MLKEIITSKAGFPFYTDYWKSYFCKMTGEQVKECLRIIFHFNETFEVLESGDLAIEMVTTTIIGNIKRDAEKRTKQITANKNNGSKGGRPPKDSKPKASQSNVEKEQFESFWNLYDKKKSRPDAEKKFKAALNKDSFENIIAGLEKYIKARSPDSQYWKNPSTWLNQECWKDDYSQVTRPTQFANKEVQRQQSNMEASKRFLQISGGDDAF